MPSVLKLPENDEGWEYQFISKFSGGINLAVRPEDIDDTEVIKAENVRFQQNRTLVDYGYKKFGAVLRGNARITFQFFKSDGSSILTCITNDTFYRWRAAVSQWIYVSDGNDTTLTGGEPTSETNMDVVSITGFSNGDFIGVDLDDGTQHQTTINGVPAGSTIILTTGLPSAAAAGKALVKAADLTGVDATPVSVDVFAPSDLMIFTNGTDTPKKFDGSAVEDVANLPGSTFVAFAVTVFKDHVLFLRTVEDGTAHPQRVRFSDTGDPSNWTTGNAGFNDLVEAEDFIVAGLKLGPYLIIYKERSIIRTEFVGLANELFRFLVVVSGEGAQSLDSVVDLGDEHIFFGNSNIYSYKGGFNIEAVGDPVFHKIFSTKGELNPAESSKVIGLYVEELDEVWYIYPGGTDTTPMNMVRYLVGETSFAERAWPTGITGFGLFVLENTQNWDDLIGDWSIQSFEWGAKTTLANAPTTHLCLGTQVVEYNYLETQDDGVAVSYRVETGDFYIPQWFSKLDYIEIALKGTVEILYSTDEGVSYTSMGTHTGTEFERIRVFEQFVGRKLRFRFIGNSADFGMEWFGFQYAIESEW